MNFMLHSSVGISRGLLRMKLSDRAA